MTGRAEPAVIQVREDPDYHWDRHRFTSVGSYLLSYEEPFARRFLAGPSRPMRVLDIGCGTGQLTRRLQAEERRFVGLDMSWTALTRFRKQGTSVPLILGDATCLPFSAGSFDSVLCMQSLQYFDHERFLAEASRVLLDEGMLIFGATNRRNYKRAVRKLFGQVPEQASYKLSAEDVLRATIAHGFEIRAVRGYNWAPFHRLSDTRLVGPFAWIERRLKLGRLAAVSPWILVAARKGSTP